MNKISFYLLGAALITTILFSCKKVEGEGGSSTITGKVIADKLNNSGVIKDTYEAMNHDVYIIYGENGTVHDDKTETSYDGTFEFKYLEKGEYTIYTYSECISCSSDSVLILKTSIKKSKEDVNIGTFEIID